MTVFVCDCNIIATTTYDLANDRSNNPPGHQWEANSSETARKQESKQEATQLMWLKKVECEVELYFHIKIYIFIYIYGCLFVMETFLYILSYV